MRKMSYISKKLLAIVSIVLAGVLSSICFNVFGSDSAFAASASITTASSITLDAVSSGTGVSIDEESVGITTTCDKGYDLTIATTQSPSLYLNGNNSNSATFTAVNGTSALNSDSNTNKWGYTLTSNASGSTVFSPLSTTASTLRTVSGTTGTTSETFSIYYGVKTDSGVAPGSYSMGSGGVITYYLTMNPLCNVVDIAYDGNNADAGTMGAADTGVIHTGVKDGDTVNLIASNFSRTGYGFAGWSLDSNAGAKLLDNDNTNNPVVYGPQETITLPDGFTNNDTDNDGIVKLYAVWIQSQGNLQGWMGCNNLDTATYDSTTGALDLTKNSVTALTDQRDNDTYAVARLADGNCWMIENLRLESTNSDNSTGALAQGYGGQFAGLADTESTNFTGSTIANSLYYIGTQSGTASVNIGTSNSPGYRMPRYNNLNTVNRATNPTSNVFTNDNTTGGMYSYGNYYTWHAAIADTTYYSSGDHNTTSICPTGWQLPLGNTSTGDIAQGAADAANKVGGFSYLDRKMGGTGAYQSTAADSLRWRTFPNNFLYSGGFSTSSANGRGSSGIYQSSTAGSGSGNSYYMGLYSSDVSPGTSSAAKSNGYSIRCIASDPVSYTLSYDANGGSGAPSSPEPITANGSATFTISGTTPTRSGYTFAGWSDENGSEVQPGGTFRTKDTNAVLYATWTNNSCNPTATTIGTGNTTTDAVCLQDVTPNMKSALPTADSTTGTHTLIDARDGQSYTIAKLADGNLWLTKNLNYGSTSDILLTSYDTDLPSGKAFKAPASTTSFETTYSSTTYVSPKILTDSTYGGYYSYAAAIASADAYTTSNQNITTSICPKGWDLPTSTQYNNLRTKSGNTTFATMSASPYSFIYAGYRNGTRFTSQTSTIRLWTSTNYSEPYAYYTTAYGTATYFSNYKLYGESVRCVASNGTATINYDGNGTTEYPVTGAVASQENVDINSTNTKTNGFTRTGWGFNGWNTAADGTGTAIAASTAISTLNLAPSSIITLYAQWIPQYTITYVNNCQTYASANSACTNAVSSTTDSSQKINLTNNPSTGTETGTLAAYNKWTLTGWKIKGWSTVADNSDNTNTEYGVGTTYTVPAGSSAGSGITLYAQWVPVYTVQYDGNGSDNDSTGMGSTNVTTGIKTVAHTNVAEGDTFDLFASNFKRAGYGFVGWSTDSDAWNKLTDNDTTNDAKIWGPNEIFTAPAPNDTPITTLYAIWAPAETSGGNPVYLQGWTGCSAMTATTYDTTTGKLTVAKNSITALTDERDGNVYTIAKLADENCWMVENLRLDNTPELSTTNTNIDSSNSTLPISNEYGSTTSNYLSATSSNWCTTNSAACDDQSRLNTTNTVATATPSKTQSITSANAHSDFSTTVYSYGNYYNWYSATAGYGTSSRSTSTPTDGDLCPVGWKLPYGNTGTSGSNIGGTKGGFSYLDKQMGGTGTYQSTSVASNKWRTFPNNFIYSGYWYGSWASDRGGRGYYWSSSAYNSYYTYLLYLDSTNVYPGINFINKYYGNSVRCVADSAKPNTIRYLPGVSSVTDNMADQTVVSSDTEVTLWASNFQRSGYGFAGWSTKPLTPETVGDGQIIKASNIPSDTTIYGPNETISDATTINKIKSEGLDLYAVWVEMDYADGMQTWASSGRCSELSIGDVTAVIDNRDDNVYAVAKLADGKCWMIENLRLDNSSTISSNNSDNPASGFSNLPATSTGWCTTNDANCVNQARINTTNVSSFVSNMSDPDQNVYSYGVYYNLFAATAGTINTSISTGLYRADGSICPAEWSLPVGGQGSNDGYELLDIRLGGTGTSSDSQTVPTGSEMSNKYRKYPNNFLNSGAYGGSDGSTFVSRGSVGFYLSDTYSVTESRIFYNEKNLSMPDGSGWRRSGYSVRCLTE